MRLLVDKVARRCIGFTALLAASLPFGMSVTGCGHKKVAVEYCNSGDSGPIIGQVAQIVLSQNLATVGESINYGQIGQSLSATAQDCKGNAVSVPFYTYASTSSYTNSTQGSVFADINPRTGQVCGGTWNRNSGGGVPDYTTCTAPTSTTNYVPVSVTPGGSPYTYTAGTAGTLTVGGGTVSSIVVTPSGGQPKAQPSNSGLFNVGVGDSVTVTYSNVPTIDFFAPNALSPVNISAVSTFAYTAPSGGTVSIAANNLTAFVVLTHAGVPSLQTATSGAFTVSAGDTVTIAYFSAPAALLVSFTPTGGAAANVPVTTSTTLSSFSYSSALGGTFALGGGSVSYLFLTHNGVSTLQPATSGLYALAAGDTATLVYTATPSVGFNPYGAVAFVTATASGSTSNAIPVYVHPIATGIILGAASTSCIAGQSVGTDCCPNVTSGTTTSAPIYNGNGMSCLSQTQTGQLVARVYANGGTSPSNDITCQVGHLSYGTENASSVVTIDENGIATAVQPGSTEITATIANSASSINAGFFSTCSPASIALTAQGYPTSTASIAVNLNNVQPLAATVLDTQGNPITGLALEFNSTEPQLVPGGSGSVTPQFPGSATITAVCQPGTCNPSGFSQIGVQGNGKPITSNGLTVNVAGHSGTVLYAAALTSGTSGTAGYAPGSQYLFVQDFTTGQNGTLVKLPFVPNSIVIALNGQSIYMGSSGGLMSLSTASNTVQSTNQAISGNVLALSPDQTTLVVTDPVRQTVSLVSASNSAVSTTYGGIGTHASFSPDSTMVYVTTTTGAVLSHSNFTDWQTATATQTYSDVAVTVPHVGAFFAGPSSTDGRSYCSNTTGIVFGNPPTAVNTFLPLAGQNVSSASVVDRVGATNDGLHLLGAHIVGGASAPTFTDIDVDLSHAIGACPAVISPSYFGMTPYTQPLTQLIPTTGTGATGITGVLPANNSLVAFITYAATSGTTGQLPYYLIPATGAGALKYLKLTGTATTPLAGVWSSDNLSFYVGTAGDNAIHLISVAYPTSTSPPNSVPTPVDSATPLLPSLPSASGTGIAPVTAIVAYPKKTTS